MLSQVTAMLRTEYNRCDNVILVSDWLPMRLFIVLFERCHVGVAI